METPSTVGQVARDYCIVYPHWGRFRDTAQFLTDLKRLSPKLPRLCHVYQDPDCSQHYHHHSLTLAFSKKLHLHNCPHDCLCPTSHLIPSDLPLYNLYFFSSPPPNLCFFTPQI
ncbi:hypothetical protein V6N13_003014 [Hibiscus sabdariffa]